LNFNKNLSSWEEHLPRRRLERFQQQSYKQMREVEIRYGIFGEIFRKFTVNACKWLIIKRLGEKEKGGKNKKKIRTMPGIGEIGRPVRLASLAQGDPKGGQTDHSAEPLMNLFWM
jgi:hypothetical protein